MGCELEVSNRESDSLPQRGHNLEDARFRVRTGAHRVISATTRFVTSIRMRELCSESLWEASDCSVFPLMVLCWLV